MPRGVVCYFINFAFLNAITASGTMIIWQTIAGTACKNAPLKNIAKLNSEPPRPAIMYLAMPHTTRPESIEMSNAG